MEIFKRVLERTVAVERHRVAAKTRRACSQQITHLEGVVSSLRAQLTHKDKDISSLESKVKLLDNEINVKKDEIHVLEQEIVDIRKALENKDRNAVVLQRDLSNLEEKFLKQTKMLATTQRQLVASRHEGDDLSTQVWQLVEENCNANKRILQLDMEVHSLEELLTRTKNALEYAEQKWETVTERAEIFRTGYEKKARELIEMSARESNLQAALINLNGELEQSRRTNMWNATNIIPPSELHHPTNHSPIMYPLAPTQTSTKKHYRQPESPDTTTTTTDTTTIPIPNYNHRRPIQTENKTDIINARLPP